MCVNTRQIGAKMADPVMALHSRAELMDLLHMKYSPKRNVSGNLTVSA